MYKRQQLQDYTTVQLDLLYGDLGDSHGELNGQEIRLSTVEKYVSNIEESISVKVYIAVKESVANIGEQIKSKVDQLMKIRQCVSKQMAEETV